MLKAAVAVLACFIQVHQLWRTEMTTYIPVSWVVEISEQSGNTTRIATTDGESTNTYTVKETIHDIMNQIQACKESS